MKKNKKEIQKQIQEMKQKLAKINQELEKERTHIDDSPWELPSLKEAEMRKGIYERKLQALEEKLRKLEHT